MSQTTNYHKYAERIIKKYKPVGVILIVVGGSGGDGMVSLFQPQVRQHVPEVLRNCADKVEAQLKGETPQATNGDLPTIEGQQVPPKESI